MKLDKIKFARLIGYLSQFIALNDRNMQDIDDMIDINVEPVALPINLSAVDGLIQCMAGGTQKIEAIKYYRSLTGYGLKESKDAVEKCWNAKIYTEDDVRDN